MHQLFEPDPDCAGGGNGMIESHPLIDGKLVADCVQRFRSRRPHVHCITNAVAQQLSANVLLAAGGTPSMTIAPGEIADFVKMADALLINLGTMDDERNKSAKIAVEVANQTSKPWALDPVFVQSSSLRLETARMLLRASPTLVRCNRGEFQALFGEEEVGLPTVASRQKTTIALTGKIDLVANGDNAVEIRNGSALMDRVTAMGCALTALMAGFCVVEEDARTASACAISYFGLAGEVAANQASGPGTFVPHFLDALASLTPNEIEKGVQIN